MTKPKRKCGYCGARFESPFPDQQYCNARHKIAARDRRKYERKRNAARAVAQAEANRRLSSGDFQAPRIEEIKVARVRK